MDTTEQASVSPSSSAKDPLRFLSGLALAIGLAICIWCITSSPLIISNDGPQAAFTTHVDAHLDDPDLIYDKQFLPGMGLTGRGFSAIYGVLIAFFSRRTALMIFQVVLTVMLGLGGVFLARARHQRLTPAILTALILPFAWPVYMGFYAYAVATALGFWILAYLLSHPAPEPLQRTVLFVLLLLQTLAHPMAAFVTLVQVLLVFYFRRHGEGPAALRAEAPWMALFSAPTVLVLFALSTASSSLAEVAHSEETEWMSFSTWIATVPRMVVPGSTVLGWVILGLGLAGAIWGAIRAKKSGHADERALAIGTLGLFAFSLFGPFHASGWQYFAMRFLWVPLCLGLSAWTIPAGRIELVGAFVASVLGIGITWNAKLTQSMLQSACADAIAGLEHPIPRTKYQLPLNLDPNCGLTEWPNKAAVPHLTPVLHLATLFAERHGGTTPYVFAGAPAAHLLVTKPTSLVPVPPVSFWSLSRSRPELINPESRRETVDQLLVYGMHYENVLVFGAKKADVEQIEARGYVQDFAQGTFYNGHFEGCHVDLTFKASSDDRGTAVFAGMGDNPLWPATLTKEDQRVRATVKTLCGEIWVQAQFANKDTCKNANAKGQFPLKVKKGEPIVIDCNR
jgi:hypothetical protein